MKIFISYRRDDTAGYAGRLFDFLSSHFGSRNVFMDIDTIQPGDDFRKVVKNAVGTCDVVLVMIGKQWLNMVNEQGRRRLEDPRDWVRVEIATALANPNVRVIPVLVRGAAMPAENELPEPLKELSWRNALELSDTRFQHDANKLIEAIEQAGGGKPASPDARVPKAGTRAWAVVTGAVLVCLFLALGGYGYIRSKGAALRTPEVHATSTDEATPTIAPTLPQAPVNLPTDTQAVPTAIPTDTPNPVPPAAEAVRYYYAQVSADNFDTTWNLLSDRYKANHNASGFGPYQDYWSTVGTVDVGNITTLSDDGRNATVLADLVFNYLNGIVSPMPAYQIKLVYDPSRQVWLIDETP